MFILCVVSVIVTYAVYVLVRLFYLEKKLVPNLKGRAVFVTGCDTGFGHDLALRLIKEDIKCFAGCLTENGALKLRQEARQYTCLLRTIIVDVTNNKSLEVATEYIEKEQKKTGLWAVVCNAGIAPPMVPDDWLSIGDYIRTADVNLWGVIRTCHAFKMLIKTSRGRFVIMTSFLGRMASKSAGPYAVSKYGAEAYGDTLRRELRHFGATVHLLEPALFRTPMSSIDVLKKGNERKHQALSDELRMQYDDKYLQRRLIALQYVVEKAANANTDLVVDAYLHAVASLYPRTRYVIGLDAKIIHVPLSYLPEWIQDGVIELIGLIVGLPHPEVFPTLRSDPEKTATLG